MNKKSVIAMSVVLLIGGVFAVDAWLGSSCRSWDYDLIRTYQVGAVQAVSSNDFATFSQLSLALSQGLSEGCKKQLAEYARRSSRSQKPGRSIPGTDIIDHGNGKYTSGGVTCDRNGCLGP